MTKADQKHRDPFHLLNVCGTKSWMFAFLDLSGFLNLLVKIRERCSTTGYMGDLRKQQWGNRGQWGLCHINKVQLFCLALDISGNLLIRSNGFRTPPNRAQLKVQAGNLFYLSNHIKSPSVFFQLEKFQMLNEITDWIDWNYRCNLNGCLNTEAQSIS